MNADKSTGTSRAAPVTRRSFLVASGATVIASCGGGGSTGGGSTGGGTGDGSTGGGSTGGGTTTGGPTGSATVNPKPVLTPAAAAISRVALDSYLARSIDMHTWALFQPITGDTLTQHEDNLRMIRNVGAKHVAFAGGIFWNLTVTYDVEAHLAAAAKIASDSHTQDPDIIVAGACFETIGAGVNNIPVPDWVFAQFGQTVVIRNFDWTQMAYTDQRPSDGNPNTPAIDITRLESRMWYYYWARRFIDIGFEDMHFGELSTVTQNDRPDFAYYWDLVGRVRTYAATHARRGFILINAQSYPMDNSGNPDFSGEHGVVNSDGYLLLDYCYAPSRPKENPTSPQDAILAKYQDTIFGRSRGGLAPNGWKCTNCPYTAQLDFGASPNPGHPIGWPYTWGWSEFDWYVNQPDAYRGDWLWYANAWLALTDTTGHFRMPGMGDGGGLPGIGWYHANIPWYSETDPNAATLNQWFKGFNDEPVIKAIWSGMADPKVLDGTFSRPVLTGGQTDTTAPDVPSWFFSGQAGVAGAGSNYLGSQTLGGGQQVAFISGSGSIAQALLFPGAKSYVVKISAAERVINGVADTQTVVVTLDGTLVGQVALDGALTTSTLSLGSPMNGVHQLTTLGTGSGIATAIIASVEIASN